MPLREHIINSLQKDVFRYVGDEPRAVVFGFDTQKELLLRFYLDRPATEEDRETLSIVITNVLANTTKNEEITTVKEECIFSQEPLGNLDVLNSTDGVHGREFWTSDGLEEGTVLLKDINPGISPGSGFPAYPKYFNNYWFFPARTNEFGDELWKSDGTEAGTEEDCS